MSDATRRARESIPCPECGQEMVAGWLKAQAAFEGGPGEIWWTDRSPETGGRVVRFTDGERVLDESAACWACRCPRCETLYLRPPVAPYDEPDEEYPWSETPCLRCGASISPEGERCPACGWTWGLDGPVPEDSA